MKKLQTLETHNSLVFRSQVNLNTPTPNGIACPKCGDELFDSNPMITLTSNPPQKNIHCSNTECGYTGYRYC